MTWKGGDYVRYIDMTALGLPLLISVWEALG